MIRDAAELLSEIALRSGFNDIANRHTVLFGLAEKMIENEIRSEQMMKTASLLTDSFGTVNLPLDYLETVELRNGTYVLPLLSPTDVRNYDRYGFFIEGGKIRTSENDMSLFFDYFARIPSLNTVSTNWLLEDDPEIYITACMSQALTMKGDLPLAREYRNEFLAMAAEHRDRSYSRSFGTRKINYRTNT